MRAAILSVVVLAALSAPAGAEFIAYGCLTGAPGAQTWNGQLGHDFDVNQPIRITQLGVFDSGANGLARTLTAFVWSRNSTGSPLAQLAFTPAEAGTLVDSSRFKPLAVPLDLPVGQYCVSVSGYGAGEPNGNEGPGAGGPSSAYKTLDTGGGLISFVGTGRYDANPSAYPASLDGGPANRYSGPTFMFIPEPASLSLLAAAGLLLLLRRRRR